nr:hypothetical protein [Tanacetum cinerariifolium]
MVVTAVNRVHVLDFAGLTDGMRQTLGDRGLLVRKFILEFLSICRMSDTEMGLDVANTLCFHLGDMAPLPKTSMAQIPGLHTKKEMAEVGFGAYWGQAPEKVAGVDIFYLRNMDRGTANVPYLLAQYLFRHTDGRLSGARLLEGHFIRGLTAQLGLEAHHLYEGWRYMGLGSPKTKEAAGCYGWYPWATEDALVADEVAQAVPAPVQAPQPLPPAPQH